MSELSTRPLEHKAEFLRVDKATGRWVSRSWMLEVIRGTDRGQKVQFHAPLIIGTGEAATFRVKDDSASRAHVEIVPKAQGIAVRDLGSTNGTWVRGLRVEQAFVDVDREVIVTVGETELKISALDATESAPGEAESFGSLRSVEPVMRRIHAQLARLAPTDTTVLLTGETGSGKDIIAREIHARSGRAGRPFVVLDCGGVSENLFESELFGHMKGSFTGASADRLGAFQTANSGTLFIDEIGELPLSLQPKLLRALESRTVRRIGANDFDAVDVRIIAATHRDLEAAVKAGTFRQDLYFRLAVVTLQVPPLRERLRDIPALVADFVKARNGGFELSPQLLDRLLHYSWPGNIRELRNVVERVLTGDESAVSLEGKAPQARRGPAISSELPFKEAKEALMEEFTREYLQQLSAACGGNVSEMARRAGVARPHLYRLVERYNVQLSPGGRADSDD